MCTSSSTRQQPLVYHSGTTKNLELSHPDPDMYMYILLSRVGSSEVVVVRYCSELQFSSSQ